MPVMRQQGQFDGKMIRDSMKELSSTFEEQVLVRQWQSQSGGNPMGGTAPTDVYKDFPTRANISDLHANDVFYPASDFIAGDLYIELRMQVFGAIMKTGNDGQTAGRKSDLVVYRGLTYYFVGHIHRIQNAGRVYWVGHMRPKGTG